MPERSIEDFERPFPSRFLETIKVLEEMEYRLLTIGLSGSCHFKALQSEIIKHGAVTLQDIERNS